MSAPRRKGPVEATIDSVGGAASMLWDWLSAEPKKNEDGETEGPSLLDFLPDSTPPQVDGRIPAKVVDKPPPDVIETEGEEV